MGPKDEGITEDRAWAEFVRQLTDLLSRAWPATQQRLGARYAAFVEHSVEQALQRHLSLAAGVARYVNLCIVWGPSFQDRPGFEWARGLLASPAGMEWSTVHRLVQRSLAELSRRPETGIEPSTLTAVDQLLLDTFSRLGRRGAMRHAEVPLPRVACDLEAAELRLVETPEVVGYHLDGETWQRRPWPHPAPLRISLAHAAPALISVLARHGDEGPAARLQVRLRAHAVCDADHHPAVAYAGEHGLTTWRGHETRAVSWPVWPLAQASTAAGPGVAVAEETSASIRRLDLECCGLRDDDDALGATRLQIWAWPATQWWTELSRKSPPVQAWIPRPKELPPGPTRCRVEADGKSMDTSALERGFAELDEICLAGVQALASQWQSLAQLEGATCEGALGMLTGRAAMTWGWVAGPDGLAGRALMRVVARMRSLACQVDLVLAGDIHLAGIRARAQVTLRSEVPFERDASREAAQPSIMDTMLLLNERFEIPVAVTLLPLAQDDGALLQACGPATGALMGEAGLRPRTTGGSGWEWFATLRLTDVTVPLEVCDPFVGHSIRVVTLLPAQSLVDWRLG